MRGMKMWIKMYDNEHNEILPRGKLGNCMNLKFTEVMGRYKYEMFYGGTYHECLVSDLFRILERTVRDLVPTNEYGYGIDGIIILAGVDNEGVFECVVDMCGYIDDRVGGFFPRDNLFIENICNEKQIKIYT